MRTVVYGIFIPVALALTIAPAAPAARVPANVVAHFKAIDEPLTAALFAAGNIELTEVCSCLPTSAAAISVASKVARVLIPALKTFDNAIMHVGFTGKAASDAITIVDTNKQGIAALDKANSAGGLAVGAFAGLQASPRFVAAEGSLSRELGIPLGKARF